MVICCVAWTFANSHCFPYESRSPATQVTLALGQLASPNGPILRDGGYANRLGALFGENGLLDQLSTLLADERGPVGLANTLADLTAEDRPIGKALARDGLLDRMADEDGPFVRLLETGRAARAGLTAGPGGARADAGARWAVGPHPRAEDGTLENVLKPGGLLEKLLEEEGILENLLMPGGTLDQLVSGWERRSTRSCRGSRRWATPSPTSTRRSRC